MIGQHRHLCSHLHIIHQQADVSQCMVFPFAGCTYKDDHLLALVQQEMDRFGLIVRLLVVYLMEYFPETVFILRREESPSPMMAFGMNPRRMCSSADPSQHTT